MSEVFKFKNFFINQDKTAMKVGTDGVLLGAWCDVSNNFDSILDIGAGTGLISLMLAQRTSVSTIDAVELDVNAYEQTVDNFENSDWADRLFCYNSSFQEFAEEMNSDEEFYDFIISNPPFFNNSFESYNSSRNVARNSEALSFEDLFLGVEKILSKNGKFAIIIPYLNENEVIELARKSKLFPNRICRVKGNINSKIKRSLIEFSFNKINIDFQYIAIETSRHNYTKEYLALTKEFYLNM